MLEALQRSKEANINSNYSSQPAAVPVTIPVLQPPLVETPPHTQPKLMKRSGAFKLATAAMVLVGLILAGAAILYVVPDRTSSTESKPETTTSLPLNYTENYKVIPTQDRFTSVREEPTTRSREIRRLSPGTIVPCRAVVKGEYIWGSSDWRYCPDVEGYIHSKLLIPAQ
jgi:hypothetical protein